LPVSKFELLRKRIGVCSSS